MKYGRADCCSDAEPHGRGKQPCHTICYTKSPEYNLNCCIWRRCAHIRDLVIHNISGELLYSNISKYSEVWQADERQFSNLHDEVVLWNWSQTFWDEYTPKRKQNIWSEHVLGEPWPYLTWMMKLQKHSENGKHHVRSSQQAGLDRGINAAFVNKVVSRDTTVHELKQTLTDPSCHGRATSFWSNMRASRTKKTNITTLKHVLSATTFWTSRHHLIVPLSWKSLLERWMAIDLMPHELSVLQKPLLSCLSPLWQILESTQQYCEKSC